MTQLLLYIPPASGGLCPPDPLPQSFHQPYHLQVLGYGPEVLFLSVKQLLDCHTSRYGHSSALTLRHLIDSEYEYMAKFWQDTTLCTSSCAMATNTGQNQQWEHPSSKTEVKQVSRTNELIATSKVSICCADNNLMLGIHLAATFCLMFITVLKWLLERN